MNIIPLHGAAGSWDEIICLVLPATIIMAIVLLVARQEQGQNQERDGAVEPDPGPAAPPAAGQQIAPGGGSTSPMRIQQAKPESEVKG